MTGSEVTVWNWGGEAWAETGFHFLDADVAGGDALEQVDLPRGPRPDLVFSLTDDRASVLALASTRGRLVDFEIPDSSFTTASVDDLDVDGREVRGRLDDVDGLITWRYDRSDERFEVDDVDEDDDDD